MKLVHTGDLHLNGDDRRWGALDTVIQTVKEQDADYLVLSGDIFHKNADSDQIRTELRNKLDGCGVEVFGIRGNHDKDGYPDDVFFGENVTFMQEEPYQVVERDEVRFIGLPFQDVDSQRVLDFIVELDDGLDGEKENVVLFHGDLVSSAVKDRDVGGEEGSSSYMPVRERYFKGTDIDYVLAGHYHTNFLTYHYDDGSYMVYPGSPVSTSKGEVGQRRVNLLDFDLGEPQMHLIDTFHYEEQRITVSGENAVGDVEEELPDEIPSDTELLVTVSGVIEDEEQAFHDELQALEAEHGVEITDECRQLSHITDTNLYEEFTSVLDDESVEGKRREELEQYFIRAASQVMSR